MISLSALPDSHVFWSPETGPVTVGAVRASTPPPCDEWEATAKMWRYIATHPDAKPWLEVNSGRTPAASAGSIA